MRRFFRSSFLFLLVATLVAPLPAAEIAATSGPICCLAKGEHHCLGHELGGEKPLGLSADSEECPYGPLALAALHGPDLTPPVSAQLVLVLSQSAPATLEAAFWASSPIVDARSERGPPALLLS